MGNVGWRNTYWLFGHTAIQETSFVGDSDRLRAVGRQLNQRTNRDMDGGTRTGGTAERTERRTIKLAPLLPDNDQPRSRLHFVFHTRRPSHHLFHWELEERRGKDAAYLMHWEFHWSLCDATYSSDEPSQISYLCNRNYL